MNFSKLARRLVIALVSLLAVSAAFAWDHYPDFSAMGRLSAAPLEAATAWTAAQLTGDLWKPLAALAVMAVIAKRSGKSRI